MVSDMSELNSNHRWRKFVFQNIIGRPDHLSVNYQGLWFFWDFNSHLKNFM